MLTMDQIFRATPENRFTKAGSEVSMENRKLGISNKTGIPMAIAKVFSMDTVRGQKKREKYTVHIYFFKKQKVKVSCSCSDFMFRWEVALHKKGSADIHYSNGEDPGTANPQEAPGCCKHIIFAYQSLSGKEIKALVSKAVS